MSLRSDKVPTVETRTTLLSQPRLNSLLQQCTAPFNFSTSAPILSPLGTMHGSILSTLTKFLFGTMHHSLRNNPCARGPTKFPLRPTHGSFNLFSLSPNLVPLRARLPSPRVLPQNIAWFPCLSDPQPRPSSPSKSRKAQQVSIFGPEARLSSP